jgi:hypothetical protein
MDTRRKIYEVMSLTGGPRLSTVPFKNLNSFNFDGVDEYFIGTSTYSELNGTTKATWSYWVKPTLGTTMVLSRVSNTTSTSAFVYMFYLFSTGEIGAAIGDTTRRSVTGSNVLTNNVWSHILVCYDGTLSNGSKTKIFINGVDSTSSDSTTATSLVNANYPLSIGRRDQTPTYYYDGFMDELAIWSGTDQRANVSEIYGGGQAVDLNTLPTVPPPLSWWRMGDNAIWNGQTWIIPNSGTDTRIARSINMVEANRTTDVPPNPFTNTLSTTFDGVDDFVRIGTTSLGITNAISVSAWVKTSNSSSNQYIIAEDPRSASNRNWLLQFRANGEIQCVIWASNGSSITSAITPLTYNNGNWTHVLATFDGTTNANGLKIYVNGVNVVQATASVSGIFSSSSSEPIIGGDSTTPTLPFNGNLDEVAVWDSAINISDVWDGSGVPFDISSSNPLSWWRCGDGDTAPTLTDNGSGGNNGTMTNFTTFSTDVPN